MKTIRFRTSVEMRSEKGPVREKNEDFLGVLQAPYTRPGIEAVYVVADGLGGHERGEVASAMAVDLLLRAFRSQDAPVEPLPQTGLTSFLADALVHINQVVYSAGLTGEALHRDPYRAGMATTLTAAVLAEDTIYLGHVGDSRAYLVREGKMSQLTEDHTLVAERVRRGLISPQEARYLDRNVITQALGLDRPVSPFTDSVALEQGDRLLLCSDGLHGFLEDEAIKAIIERRGREGVVDSLIEASIAEGSTDNITAILVSFDSLF
ncbi:MAG: serine/threonine-protein phosphatase [Chloroflexi bacterium]|nr:serine/threonine-protein phosphatase [Chloroflexota bacterium]